LRVRRPGREDQDGEPRGIAVRPSRETKEQSSAPGLHVHDCEEEPHEAGAPREWKSRQEILGPVFPHRRLPRTFRGGGFGHETRDRHTSL
jgi:hypothetical protein